MIRKYYRYLLTRNYSILSAHLDGRTKLLRTCLKCLKNVHVSLNKRIN